MSEPEAKVAAEIKGIKDAFDAAQKELGAQLQKQDAEIKQHGATSGETAKALTAVEASLKQIAEDLKGANERMTELEKRNGRPDMGPNGEQKTLGARFAESDQYLTFKKGGSRGSNPMHVGHFWAPSQKAVLTSTTASGEIVAPMRVPEIIGMAERMNRVRDLIPSFPTSSNAIEYIRELGYYTEGATQAVTSITHVAGLATITTTAAHGWTTHDLVRISGANQAGYNIAGRVTVTGASTATYLVDPGTVSPATGTILALKLNATGAAAPTAEGDVKPQAALEFSLETAPVRTVAHWLPATRQVLDDNTQLRAYIDQRLLYGLALEEDAQLLLGDGTGVNLLGILNEPSIQTYAWSEGLVGPPADTKIDAFRKAMTRVFLADYPVTGMVLNPIDWQDIELAKGTDGHYLWISVPNGGGGRFFQVPVVSSNAIPAGTGLVGAFALAATIWDREMGSIRVSEEHSDYFVRNQLAILAEERLALTIYRPESFVKVLLDEEPS